MLEHKGPTEEESEWRPSKSGSHLYTDKKTNAQRDIQKTEVTLEREHTPVEEYEDESS